MWSAILLLLLTRGGGAIALDHLIASRVGETDPAPTPTMSAVRR